LAWQLFTELGSQLNVGGMGGILGISFASLRLLLEAYYVPQGEWSLLIQKLNAINEVATKHWNKKQAGKPVKASPQRSAPTRRQGKGFYASR